MPTACAAKPDAGGACGQPRRVSGFRVEAKSSFAGVRAWGAQRRAYFFGSLFFWGLFFFFFFLGGGVDFLNFLGFS